MLVIKTIGYSIGAVWVTCWVIIGACYLVCLYRVKTRKG